MKALSDLKRYSSSVIDEDWRNRTGGFKSKYAEVYLCSDVESHIEELKGGKSDECVHDWLYVLDTPDSKITYECLKCDATSSNNQEDDCKYELESKVKLLEAEVQLRGNNMEHMYDYMTDSDHWGAEQRIDVENEIHDMFFDGKVK